MSFFNTLKTIFFYSLWYNNKSLGSCIKMEGYKLLYDDLKNQYGLKMEVGKTYQATGEIKFGTNGNGYHFCGNFEDCFKYAYGSRNIHIVKIIADGKIIETSDLYNGFDNLYVAQIITIKSLLTKEDIVNKALQLNEMALNRFLKLYPLTEKEKTLFIPIVKNNFTLNRTFEYYQNNNKDIYKQKIKCMKKELV